MSTLRKQFGTPECACAHKHDLFLEGVQIFRSHEVVAVVEWTVSVRIRKPLSILVQPGVRNPSAFITIIPLCVIVPPRKAVCKNLAREPNARFDEDVVQSENPRLPECVNLSSSVCECVRRYVCVRAHTRVFMRVRVTYQCDFGDSTVSWVSGITGRFLSKSMYISASGNL